MNAWAIKILGVVVVLAMAFGAGFVTKGRFDKAAIATAMIKAEKHRETLAEKSATIQQKATNEKSAHGNALSSAQERISKLPATLDQKLPPSYILEWNK